MHVCTKTPVVCVCGKLCEVKKYRRNDGKSGFKYYAKKTCGSEQCWTTVCALRLTARRKARGQLCICGKVAVGSVGRRRIPTCENPKCRETALQMLRKPVPKCPVCGEERRLVVSFNKSRKSRLSKYRKTCGKRQCIRKLQRNSLLTTNANRPRSYKESSQVLSGFLKLSAKIVEYQGLAHA